MHTVVVCLHTVGVRVLEQCLVCLIFFGTQWLHVLTQCLCVFFVSGESLINIDLDSGFPVVC